MPENADFPQPLDEQMYEALADAGLDESEAVDVTAAVLPLFAEWLRMLAAQAEWTHRSMTFTRGNGCGSETRLHAVGDWLRGQATSLLPSARDDDQ